ncbi:MAG: glycosyltransferase family 1 protein [Desulfobacteraceae bacterium]|nr:glycosyltransferase family 1 protein [Desulfobacteraceae bacterium]
MNPLSYQKKSVRLRIAMLSIHSSPIGPLGAKNTGGMSVYVKELARALGSCGHFVDIFTYFKGENPVENLYPNVRLIHLGGHSTGEIPKDQLASRLNDIFNLLENYRKDNHIVYDLVHSHYWLSGVIGAMAQTRWRRPHLTMFHTLGMVKNNTAKAENESDLRIAHERWLAKAADQIVAPSDREKEHLLHHYHADAGRIRVISCGVNQDLFKPMDFKAARKRLKIAQDAQIALYIGRFAPLKGIDDLIGAVVRLSSQFPRLELIIIGGDGPESAASQQLKQLAGNYGARLRVSFTGRIDQSRLPLYYSAADMLVLPSHYESFGLVVLEALSCGTPVVATPVGAVESILCEGFNGVVADSSGIDSIAQAIAKLLSLPKSGKPSQEQIRTTVCDFSWASVADQMVQVYENLLKAYDPAETPAFCGLGGVFPN